MTESYPSNCREPKPEASDSKRESIVPVVTGPVLHRDKGLGQKFAELFIAENIKTAWAAVLVDTLVPAAKETCMDVVNGLGERTLGISIKKTTGYRGPVTGVRQNVPYSGMFRGTQQPSDKPKSEEIIANAMPFNIDDFIISDRGEAQMVLDGLSNLIENYDRATVADFYSLVGKRTAPYTYGSWGWEDIREAEIRRIRGGGGYTIHLPKPIHLD